jgi:drug/metabolite transporter (DMT)-like permease
MAAVAGGVDTADRKATSRDGTLGNPLAVIFALGAATLYGAGNALEHRVVADADEGDRVRGGLFARLIRSPLWILGMFGDVGAYGLQAAALAFGALVFVQPLLVCGLLVALPLNAHWTHRRIRGREWVAAVLLCASLAIFLMEAAPSGGSAHASLASWLRVGGIVGAVAVGALVTSTRTRGHVRAALLGFAAGALFGVTAALTKTFVSQIQHGVPYTAAHWEVYALAVLSITGILLTQHGFQSASLSASLPALEASEPVIAAVVGVTLLHEHLNVRTALDGVVLAISVITLLASVIALAAMAGRDASVPSLPVELEPRARGRVTNRRAISRHDGYRPRHWPAIGRRSRTRH